MEDRSRRIVETAIELAEAGGFDAVRLRDVASQAGVALGTVYKRFPSKEDILVAALEKVADRLEQRLLKNPPQGDTPLERVSGFFKTATRALIRKPNLARALLRAVASGEPDHRDKVMRFHGRSTMLIIGALQGSGTPSKDFERIAIILQHVWFASLVGWMGGLKRESEVVSQVREAAELLLAGLEAEKNAS